MITESQAKALATILHEIRPRWSIPAMMKVLERHSANPAPFADITSAAVNAARDPIVETPGCIFTDQRFWPENAKSHLPKPEHCDLHISYYKHNCGGCRADQLAESGNDQ